MRKHLALSITTGSLILAVAGSAYSSTFDVLIRRAFRSTFDDAK